MCDDTEVVKLSCGHYVEVCPHGGDAECIECLEAEMEAEQNQKWICPAVARRR